MTQRWFLDEVYRALELTVSVILSFERNLQKRAIESACLLKTWYLRAEQRRQLAQLNDSALKDMGISRIDAHAEANKPFWGK